MSEKTNTYAVDTITYERNRLLYMGFLVGLGYDPQQMVRAPLSFGGYHFVGDAPGVRRPWNSLDDWEAVLNVLPLVQI